MIVNAGVTGLLTAAALRLGDVLGDHGGPLDAPVRSRSLPGLTFALPSPCTFLVPVTGGQPRRAALLGHARIMDNPDALSANNRTVISVARLGRAQRLWWKLMQRAQ